MAEPTIRLDHLTAGRDQADAYADTLGDVTGQDVTVDARSVWSTTGSFTDQLVRRLAAARRVTVIGWNPDTQHWVTDATRWRQITDRFVFVPGDTP